MEQSENLAQKRQISILVILIVAIATPATLALSYYHLTGDPSFRPLALTVERLVASGQTLENVDVQGYVIVGRSEQSRELGMRFGERLRQAFYGKGLEAAISLHPEPKDGKPTIIFRAGSTIYGPFEMHDAPHAVQVVSESIKLRKDPAYAAPEQSW